MTLEELQAMSNEELNELSAVKVMGLHKFDALVRIKNDWNPTEDMNDAMELVNKIFHDTDYGFAFGNFSEEWSAWFVIPNDKRPHKNEGEVVCESPSRAITIASILAKESE